MADSQVVAITMVRNEVFFLEKWIAHYGAQLGHEHLYVLLHGNAAELRGLDNRVNFINIPVRKNDTVGYDRFNEDRFSFINALGNELNNYFDWVIVTDVDEFMVVDPDLGVNLPEYLAQTQSDTVLSVIGLDVTHRTDDEPDSLNLDENILAQRQFCRFQPLYCKPAIASKAIKRAKGNHYSTHKTLTFGSGLYLFHLKFMDHDFSLAMHATRDQAYRNERPDMTRSLIVPETDFRWKTEVTDGFAAFNTFAVDEEFDFTDEITHCHATWRRRRFWAQKAFWQALFTGQLNRLSLHFRFDLTKSQKLYRIPDKFSDCL
jgi:hypothetical protein